MRGHILSKLAQIEGINCTALISEDGFLIERTSNEFDLSKLISLFDTRPNDILLTLVGEDSNAGCNLGSIRNELTTTCELLEDHV